MLSFAWQHIAVRLPISLPTFELLVVGTEEFPQLCVGMSEADDGHRLVHFDLVELSGAAASAPGELDSCSCCRCLLTEGFRTSTQLAACVCADGGASKASQVTQLDRDTILIVLEGEFPPRRLSTARFTLGLTTSWCFFWSRNCEDRHLQWTSSQGICCRVDVRLPHRNSRYQEKTTQTES